MTLTYGEVAAAARRLHGVANATPVVTSRTLDELTGASVFIKCENLQRMGAFKFRGAYNRMVQLDGGARERGVVAFSSGNHAQGVALAAKLLQIRATIVMPGDAPAPKVAATRGYGATVVFYDRMTADREAVAREICERDGATLVPPYDDEQVIAGQGTAALELFEQTPGLDVIVAPVGGGGLLAGTALAANGSDPDVLVYGVEPEAGDDFARSLEKGERITIPVPKTIADGQQTTSPGAITFPIVQRYAAGIVTVSDEEIEAAMRFAFARLKLVFEPSGATSLAAALGGKIPLRGKRAGLICSGGNADPALFARILARG